MPKEIYNAIYRTYTLKIISIFIFNYLTINWIIHFSLAFEEEGKGDEIRRKKEQGKETKEEIIN